MGSRANRARASGIPLGVKWVYTAWVALWLPLSVRTLGLENLLWLCGLANLIVLPALWRESRVWLSAQALSVVLVGCLWTADVAGALLAGRHPIGGTEYMFSDALPLHVRLLSLFHVFMPVLLLWSLRRLGYDPRALALQTLLTWIVLPATFFLSPPERDINWVFGPFGKPQGALPPALYAFLHTLAYPLVVYVPSHAALKAWAGWRKPR